jgi:DNA-binding MarR family transcriptional regulator
LSQTPDSRTRVAELTRELYRQATALAWAITESSGLHHTDAAALRALDAAADEPVTVSRLGADLGLSSGAVTALVDRLEQHGMVRRERDAADRRRVYVALTPKARQLGSELLAPIGERIQRAIGDLGEREVEAVAAFLGTLIATDDDPDRA